MQTSAISFGRANTRIMPALSALVYRGPLTVWLMTRSRLTDLLHTVLPLPKSALKAGTEGSGSFRCSVVMIAIFKAQPERPP